MSTMPRCILTILTLSVALPASAAQADEIAALIEALEDAGNRQGASIALAKLGRAAVPALRESLTAKDPDMRVWSAYTLGEIGPAAKSATGDLIQALAFFRSADGRDEIVTEELFFLFR